MMIYLVISLFVLLLVLTISRMKHSLFVTNHITNSIIEFTPFLQKHDSCVVFFYDAYTCVRTMKYMEKLHQYFREKQIPFLIINVTEGADPIKGKCPVCPYLERLQVKFVPILYIFQEQEVVHSLSKMPDRLDYNEIIWFTQQNLDQVDTK